MTEMAVFDLLAKIGLGATSLMLLALLLFEARRHDKTRDQYLAQENARLALQQERIEADRELTKVLSVLSERITVSTGHRS